MDRQRRGSEEFTIVRHMNDKWIWLLEQVKHVSTFTPSTLIDDDEYRLTDYVKHLNHTLVNLDSDYRDFLVPYFVYTDNSFIAVITRFNFYACRLALVRLKTALSDYKNRIKDNNRPSLHDVLTYLSAVLYPGKWLYHRNDETPEICADIMHYVYTDQLKIHLASIVNSHANIHETQSLDLPKNPEEMFIYKRHQDDEFAFNASDTVNEHLIRLATLHSLPAIPDNLIGVLLSSAPTKVFEKEDYELIHVGANNRSRVVSITDYRICIRCKLTNSMLGQTDDQEQRERRPCQCVIKHVSGIDSRTKQPTENSSCGYVYRALYLSRLVAVKGTGYTCKTCKHHKLVLEQSMASTKTVLDNLNIFNCGSLR